MMKKRTITVNESTGCLLEAAHKWSWSHFVVESYRGLCEVFINPDTLRRLVGLGIYIADEIASDTWGLRVRDSKKNVWRRRFSYKSLEQLKDELDEVTLALSGKQVDVWYADLPND